MVPFKIEFFVKCGLTKFAHKKHSRVWGGGFFTSLGGRVLPLALLILRKVPPPPIHGTHKVRTQKHQGGVSYGWPSDPIPEGQEAAVSLCEAAHLRPRRCDMEAVDCTSFLAAWTRCFRLRFGRAVARRLGFMEKVTS